MTDLTTAPASDVAETLAARHVAQHGDRTERSAARRGILLVLGWLDGQPGQTWQHRWVAADADWFIRDQLDQPDRSKDRRYCFRLGLALLVQAGVLRPGMPVVLTRRGAGIALRGVEQAHRADLDRVVTASSANVKITERAALTLRHACAAMIVLTGKPLPEITPDEWAASEQYRRDAYAARNTWTKACAAAQAAGSPAPARPKQAEGHFRLVSLQHCYTAVVAAGLMAPNPDPAPGMLPIPPTLARACALPETLDNVLDNLGTDLPPKVRALFRDAYSLEGGALDNSTLRRNIVDLNSYMRYVQMVLPGHDSLDIPMHARDLLLRTIRETPAQRRRAGTKRLSVSNTLGRVRSQYGLADRAVHQYGLTDHLPAVGPFPWPPNVLHQLSKNERAHSRAKLTQTVRAHIGHLDGLVAAAHSRVARLERLAAAAHAAENGQTFEHEGVAYSRTRRVGSEHIGEGRGLVRIRLADGWNSWDVDEAVHRAAKARTLVVLLRETGLRIEEASELTVDSVAPYTDGDLTFPVLNIRPSKQDRARTIACQPVVLEAVADLLRRNRAMCGRDPLVDRTDRHENVEQQPAHLLFFTYHQRAFVGPHHKTLAIWINDVVDEYNERHNTGLPLPPVTPHQMRRMFATDLAERGVDPIAVKETLGHLNLATTGVYFHPDEAKVIAEIVEARRRARAAGNGTPCAQCQGTGYATPDQPHHPQGQHDDADRSGVTEDPENDSA